MRLKKFFAPNTKQSESETDTQQSDLYFKSEPKFTGPVTRAMKKLLQQKDATEMAISVLCDLSKYIAQCVSANKNFQITRYFLTQCLLNATLQNKKVGSLTNNQCALGASYNLVNI